MDEIQKREKKILDAIQQLKDSVFGMETSYAQYCYSVNEHKSELDFEKVNQFIYKLINYASADSRFTAELKPLIQDFLTITLQYLDSTFASYEYKFSSIRKIAYTIRKNNAEQKSTFDILITDVEQDLSTDCFALYKKFTNDILSVDQESFYLCIKHALEKFVDEHGLNCIDDENAVDQMVSKIHQLAYRVKLDNRQLIRAKAEKQHGE